MASKGFNQTIGKEVWNLYTQWIRKARVWLWIAFITGVTLGVVYVMTYKPYYKARFTFLINESKSGIGGGALSSLAGQLGLSGTSPGLNEDRIVFLLNTERIIGNAMLQPFNKEQRIGDALAHTFHLDDAWKADTSMDDFKGFAATQMESASFQEHQAIHQLTQTLSMSNRYAATTVKGKTNAFVGNSNSGIITISFESRNEALAAAFVRAIYQEASAFYIRSMTKSLQDNFELLSYKADSVKALLSNKEEATASASDAAFNVFKSSGKLPEVRLKRDVEMLGLMYAEVVKNKEIARFNLDQEKPIFQVVDEPYFPLEKIEKSMLVYVALGASVMVMGALFGLSLLFVLRNRSTIAHLLN